MRGLSLLSRLGLAYKAITTPFDAGSSQMVQRFLGGIFPTNTGPAPARNAPLLLQTFNTSPWIRACAGKVADGTSSVMWRLYKMQSKTGAVASKQDCSYVQRAPSYVRDRLIKDLANRKELVEITDHPMLNVMRAGSAHLTGWDTRWVSQIHRDLVGESFLMIQRNALKKPEAFWVIPPHWVAETPTPRRPFYRIQWMSFQADVPAFEILWQKSPNPLEPYQRGTGLANSLDDDLATDEYATKHTMKFFKNSARPDLLIWPKEGEMDAVERDRLETWWNEKLQGFWKSFRPLFMKTAMEVTVLEQNFRSLQLVDLRKHERDTIMQTWGIPPEMFGVIASSNRSTIDQSPFIFTKYCLTPRLDRQRDFYQDNLVREFDERLILDYVSPVPEDKDFKLKVMVAQPSAFYLNEFRESANFNPLPELDGEFAAGAMDIAQVGAETPEEEEPPKKTPEKDLSQLDDEEVGMLYRINRKLVAR